MSMDYKEMQAAVEAGKRAGLLKLAEKVAATAVLPPEPPPVRPAPRTTLHYRESFALEVAEQHNRTAMARYKQKLQAEEARILSELDAIYTQIGKEAWAIIKDMPEQPPHQTT